ncbi:hypothetical protein QQG74_19520 [Micromonospora sp. FIMYZ51]|uniref:hypothetical protein n=1 Tax=Micromonospora sp. FIMYZ51 TaxID=3051832 RepID=UPI00311E31C3
MADDIRQALTRLAEPVVPGPDPYQRLLARVRRRRQRRVAVLGVAGVVAAAMALPVFGAAGRLTVTGVASSPPPAAGTYQPASPIDKPMARQLLDSPTRGNLADDRTLIAEIERQYRASRAELLVDPTLDEVKVLLAHDMPDSRTVVVAFLDASHALIRRGDGQAGASVPELLRKTGTPVEPQPLEPYVFLSRHSPVNGGRVTDLTAGLAPAGCLVEASTDGRLQPDGSVARSWQVVSTEGYVVRGPGEGAERWRFTCQGVVRYDGPAGGGSMIVYPEEAAPPVPTDGARGSVDATLAATAARELDREMKGQGLLGPVPQVIWGGQLPDWVPGAPAAVLVRSCSTDAGCAAMLRVEVEPGRSPQQPGLGAPSDYWTTKGGPDLTVVPVPGGSGGVLVFGPESATDVKFLDGKKKTIASGRLDSGVGVIHIDPDQVAEVQVFDKGGQLLETANLRADFGQLGEPTVWAW